MPFAGMPDPCQGSEQAALVVGGAAANEGPGRKVVDGSNSVYRSRRQREVNTPKPTNVAFPYDVLREGSA